MTDQRKPETARIPALRFKGFTDPWEQRELGEVGFTTSGVGFPDAEQGGEEGVPFFKVSDMNTPGNERVLIHSNNYVTDEQISRMNWRPVSQVPAMFFAKVGAAVMLNRKRLVNEPFLLDNNTMAFSMDVGSIDPGFGQSLFERLDFTSLIQTGALPSYNGSDVEGIRVWMPNEVPEQQAIGSFFQQLDFLITLHQRKHDKLKTVKQSLLDKMFPKEGESEPEIRFEGFTDPWEQRKLGDYLIVANAKNTDRVYSRNDVLSVSGEYGVVNQIEFQGRSFAGADVSAYGILETGDVVYTKSPLKTNPYGIIKSNLGKSGIVSTLYATYSCTEQIDPKFVDVYFSQNARVNNYLHPLVNKGAKNDMKVSAESALQGLVAFPLRAEQQAIGTLFAKLDSLITLHQRE